MKSVAISGFSPVSISGLKDTPADEIWTMNHAYKVPEVPRDENGELAITKLFDIHNEWWITRGNIPEHMEYWEWLQQEHPFQIVVNTNDDYKMIPGAWPYPFEEVCQAAFGNLYRQMGAELVRETYFTNSFDYMAQLAAFQGYDRVYLYGIDMASDTEYSYQKPGGSFHIGNLTGRGVEVIIPEATELCKSKLYGFDSVPAMTFADIQEYSKFYEAKVASSKALFNAATEEYQKTGGKDKGLYMDWRYAHARYAMYYGALEFTKRFSEMNYLSRQNIDQMHVQFARHSDTYKANANVKHGRFDSYENGDQDRKAELFEEMIAAAQQMHANYGALQVTRKWLNECDMKEVNPDLILDMKLREREG